MGEAELHKTSGELIIRSVFYFYGDASNQFLAEKIASDISVHWNEPESSVFIRRKNYRVIFDIKGYHDPSLLPETVWYNDDQRMNYFRLENYAVGNISFVDGIGSNTGYFKLDNLLQTSTTAAHEYGHTIGLVHPKLLDIRGGKLPGIMYPRGTICDPPLQYITDAMPGDHGGFLDPKNRRVFDSDIQALQLHKLEFNEHGVARLGEFSSLYHERHDEEIS
ncbi:MAG TPA: hypothetical protein VM101_03975 [Flavitalea sp.]|nr:hypothetical protein [Flavitalea sp.]